jgi:hypothetical protein
MALTAAVAASSPLAGPPDPWSGFADLEVNSLREVRLRNATLFAFEHIVLDTTLGARSAPRSAQVDRIVGSCRPALQALVARTRTTWKLPGGDIFLDLHSADTRNLRSDPDAVKSQSGVGVWAAH